MGELISKNIQGVVDSILADYNHDGQREIDKLDIFNKPNKKGHCRYHYQTAADHLSGIYQRQDLPLL